MKEKRTPKPKRRWTCDGCHGIVHAHTKSEARSAFKKLLDMKRLPKGISPEEMK